MTAPEVGEGGRVTVQWENDHHGVVYILRQNDLPYRYFTSFNASVEPVFLIDFYAEG
jgi:hypothetical protein